jgi:prevent-host-death family protein
MRSIPHRELRNNSSKILDDVKNGEVIEVRNHGELVAVLVPPSTAPYDRLVAAGKVRVADPSRRVDLRRVRRRRGPVTTADILDDVRGGR